jgi:HAMP domain-containing protein
MWRERVTLPRERRFKLLIAIAFAAIVLISVSSYLSRAADELQILFNNYVKGKESAIINLHVEVPKVNADWCTVYVARFPTPSNPVKKGGLELVALKRTRPGQGVVVKSFIENAIPVAYKRDPDTGALKILYREPQEYLISVKCYKKINDRKARLVGVYTHIHEVRIKKPIMDVEINAKLAQPKPVKLKLANMKKRDYGTLNLGLAPNSVPCNFGNSDACLASTRLARLNSIPDLEVKYKLKSDPPSAVY